MQLLESFTEHRSLLFAIAYRMLGSVMDAEDMVQETFLRWQQAPASEIDNARAYLSTIITRLCIDHLRSARVQREQYIGPWLPEPLVQEAGADPASSASLGDSLSVAFLLLLERLAPSDRAVFLLHEVFDYDYQEVGQIVGKSAAACRQIVHRARERIVAGRPRFAAPADQVARMTEQFRQTCEAGDMEGLLALLAEDVTLVTDGGGKAAAARKVVTGAQQVARFIFGVMQKAHGPLTAKMVTINGQSGLITYMDGHPVSTLTLDIHDGQIVTFFIVVNPEKLRRLPVV